MMEKNQKRWDLATLYTWTGKIENGKMIPGLANGKRSEEVEGILPVKGRSMMYYEGEDTSRTVSLNGTLSVKRIPGPV